MWRSAATCKLPGAWQIAWSAVVLHGCLWCEYELGMNEPVSLGGSEVGAGGYVLTYLGSSPGSGIRTFKVLLMLLMVLKEPASGSQPLPSLSTRSRAEGTHTGWAHQLLSTESRPGM